MEQSETITKLARAEAMLQKQLADEREENNRYEMEELLMNDQLEQSDTLLECLDLMAQLGLWETQYESA